VLHAESEVLEVGWTRVIASNEIHVGVVRSGWVDEGWACEILRKASIPIKGRVDASVRRLEYRRCVKAKPKCLALAETCRPVARRVIDAIAASDRGLRSKGVGKSEARAGGFAVRVGETRSSAASSAIAQEENRPRPITCAGIGNRRVEAG